MTDRINLLGDRPSPRMFTAGAVARLTTRHRMVRAVDEADAATLWVASESRFTDELLRAIFGRSKARRAAPQLGRMLLMHEPRPAQIQPLEDCFTPLAWPPPAFHWLPDRELAAVLGAPNRGDLALGGHVDPQTQLLTLCRGDLTHLAVPLGLFKPAGDGAVPDGSRFAIADYGHTIRLGDYESSMDAILYEADPAYRARMKARRRVVDVGFGASLRRLRIQRGLRQGDFEPAVRRETIVRLEQARTQTPRSQTRRLIAQRLGVAADMIESY